MLDTEFTVDIKVHGEAYQRRVAHNGFLYWVVAGYDDQGEPFVALPVYGKAANMAWQHYVHPSYAASKLGLGKQDAEVVSQILNTWRI